MNRVVVIGADIEGNIVMPGMRGFIIGYKGLNKKECIELVSLHWADSEKLGLLSITIKNQIATREFSWGNEELPLTRNIAKQYCQENNDIIWTFE